MGVGAELSYHVADAAPVDDAPAVRAVDEIFDSAIRSRASDVHIEPVPGGGRVRERVDGVLREARRLPEGSFARVLSRIKLLAGMDIADRRMPQDGRYAIERADRTIDARVSSMPTICGERLAIRLLDAQARVPTLERLGMPPALVRPFRRLVHAPAGFVVVCGPTGSGKTTTLYASLAERNVEGQQICTIEDPVEARLAGVAQVQINVRAGLTFGAALRSFLRQDPNVIMVGEMRDAETACAGISAALSGQLVLTTLHSNDALRAVERLCELGVTQRGIASAVSGIVSQRLLRRLCGHCKRPARSEVAAYEAVGCERCGGIGYCGRSAVFELTVMSEAMREAIEAHASPARLKAIASSGGYEPLEAGAARLVLGGETSLEEVARVIDEGVAC